VRVGQLEGPPAAARLGFPCRTPAGLEDEISSDIESRGWSYNAKETKQQKEAKPNHERREKASRSRDGSQLAKRSVTEYVRERDNLRGA